jgi:lysyl-tRNA synthetase class 2
MAGAGENIRRIRQEKVERLRELGIDPYPSTAPRTHEVGELVADFDRLEGQDVAVAGRLMARRGHGKLSFLDLQDGTGRMQVMLRANKQAETSSEDQTLGFQDALDLVDIGDFIGVAGELIRTRTGEITVAATSLRILTKALLPLPDKWHGVTDEETLVRRRYLDLIMNPEKQERFRDVAKITLGIRTFLAQEGFVEFNTPVLQPLYGGGRAKPFTTHVNALDVDYYLAISHELYLKRLIVAGFEKVFTIGRYFRNEGIDKTHNPEFSMLETMTAFEGYEYNMDLTERLYRYLAYDVLERDEVVVDGHVIDLRSPWRRASMVELVQEVAGVDFREVTELDEANRILAEHDLHPQPTVGHALVELFEAVVEPTLIQPTIVFGHPVEISPLAKATADDPRYVERFELFIAGTEQGDNWSELNDPTELAERFAAEEARAAEDDEAHPRDSEFVQAMEHGMPPTTGLGPGVERLAMLLTGAETISDVIFFPLLRPLPADAADPLDALYEDPTGEDEPPAPEA